MPPISVSRTKSKAPKPYANMAALINNAPGISAAPANRQLPPKLQSRSAKKLIIHAGRQ